MSTYMHNNICTPYFLPVTVGCYVLMSWWTLGIMEHFTDLAVTPRPRTAPFRLDTDHNITVLDPGDYDLAFINHGRRNLIYFLSGRVAPSCYHLLLYFRTKVLKPRHVLLPGYIT